MRPTTGRSIAFFPVPRLRIPHNNREYYLSRELADRGWSVFWLRPRSGTNDGVRVQWPVLLFRDLDFRGRTYYLPFYLAFKLRLEGVRIVWISGYTIRAPRELWWMIKVMKTFGIRVIYDPIDPVCEILAAQQGADPSAECTERMARIYAQCDLVPCVTPQIKDLLAEHGAPEDRLMVARWGTDDELFDPDRTPCGYKDRLGLDQNSFLVGWLGTMEHFKGLTEVIMPLVEHAAKQRDRRLHFVIAGRGSLEDEVRTWAGDSSDLPVSILPPIEYTDAPNFTGSLDAYLVPTNPATAYARSICPVKCFDALAIRTPLIVTPTPATRFLDQYPSVSFADFDAGSFWRSLMELRDRRYSNDFEPEAIHVPSHQTVSVELADAIDNMVRSTADFHF